MIGGKTPIVGALPSTPPGMILGDSKYFFTRDALNLSANKGIRRHGSVKHYTPHMARGRVETTGTFQYGPRSEYNKEKSLQVQQQRN
jgi:hypothetical protein